MEIEIYETKGGKCSILKKLREIDKREAKKVWKRIEDLRNYELKQHLKSETVKQLENNLYELKTYNYRLTFIIKDDCYFLLTIFKKQGNKTPLHELEKARNLKKLILGN